MSIEIEKVALRGKAFRTCSAPRKTRPPGLLADPNRLESRLYKSIGWDVGLREDSKYPPLL